MLFRILTDVASAEVDDVLPLAGIGRCHFAGCG